MKRAVWALAAAVAAALPGTVTDLTVTAATDTTLTLRWTEVPSGAAGPASYDVRVGPAAGFVWWNAAGAASGSCKAVQVGQSVTGGAVRTCVVGGLRPSTSYSVQVVAFTGTMNVNASFGPLSNVAPGMTAATPPPVPPPAPSPTVTNVAVIVLPLVISVSEHNYAQVFGVIGRSDGTFAPSTARLRWTTENPTIATVDSLGAINTFLPGQVAITATDPVTGLNAVCTLVVSAGVPISVGAIRVTNTPGHEYVRFPPRPLWTQGYRIELLAPNSDSLVARAVLQVYKP